MNFFRTLLAATAEGGAEGGSLISSLSPLIMLVVLVVVFYFFVMRPQKKQEKQVQSMRDSLQVGDEITTIGGIIGKIVSIKDETVIIETGRDHVTMRILKSAVKNVDVPAQASYSESNKHND